MAAFQSGDPEFVSWAATFMTVGQLEPDACQEYAQEHGYEWRPVAANRPFIHPTTGYFAHPDTGDVLYLT